MAIGVQITTFNFFGTAILNEVFGFFKAPSAVQIQRIQLSAQQGPVGGNITVTLVNQAGTSLGASAVLAAGTVYSDTTLASPITLGPGSIVRAKITGVDIGVGGYLTVNIMGATAQGTPTPPSGCRNDQCAPPSAQMLFFPGTKGDRGPEGPASTVPGPPGDQGLTGAVGVYRGDYLTTRAYYDTQFRKDIVAYGGQFWIANNPLKSGTANWEAPNVADWASFGTTLNMVATALQLLEPADINVGLNIEPPGYIKSDNFVQGSSGTLLSGTGRLESYDALINGLLSSNTPRFNLGSITRTMPSIGYGEFDIGAIADGDIPVNPSINNVTDDALIFFGWLQGANNFLENRFGNATQKFQITVQGTGTNTSAGADLFYIQLYYRVRASGGAWGGWNLIGQDAYMQKIAGVDQSFQNTQPLRIALAGNNDIQFSAGFSKGAAGVASVGGAKISVLALN